MNKEAEEVIKRLSAEHKRFTVKLNGSLENKDVGYKILLLAQGMRGFRSSLFHGVHKRTVVLLKEAKVKIRTFEE